MPLIVATAIYGMWMECGNPSSNPPNCVEEVIQFMASQCTGFNTIKTLTFCLRVVVPQKPQQLVRPVAKQ